MRIDSYNLVRIKKIPEFTGIYRLYKKILLGQDNTPPVGDHGMGMMNKNIFYKHKGSRRDSDPRPHPPQGRALTN